MCCKVIIKFIPVILLTIFIAWSWYTYVFKLCLGPIHSSIEALLMLVFYHISLFFLLWSYYKTIFTKIAPVPPLFKVSKADMDQLTNMTSLDEQSRFLKNLSKDLPIVNCTINNCVRFCEKCQHIKPDRSHHCSVCNACNLKFDHHCPWVNNCINFSNYKYFILFLGYGLTYCIYVCLSMLKYFILFWMGKLENTSTEKIHLFPLFGVAFMFAVFSASLLGYHIYLVLKNRTTLETLRPPIFCVGGPDKNGFSLGYRKNFEQVFGTEKKYWLLPIFTSLGDGVKYPVRKHLLEDA